MSSENARRENAELERRVKRRLQWLHRNRWPPSWVVPSLVTTSELQRGQAIDTPSWHSDYPPHVAAREPYFLPVPWTRVFDGDPNSVDDVLDTAGTDFRQPLLETWLESGT